jgi:hypothetical protein
MLKLFSFSLRELFGLTLIAALSLGWWLDHASLVTENVRDETDVNRWRFRCDFIAGEFERDKGNYVAWDDEGIVAQSQISSCYTSYPDFHPSRPFRITERPILR